MQAIFQAYNFSTQYVGTKVEILLETGVHFVRPTSIEQYIASVSEHHHVDFTNPSFDMVIKPVECNDTTLSWLNRTIEKTTLANGTVITKVHLKTVELSYKTTDCRDLSRPEWDAETMNKVTVSNKIGNRFFIQVPQSLLFEGITFEGIDSL